MRIRLNYPIERVREPVIYRLIKDFRLVANVLTARIDVHTGGVLVLDVTGEPDDLTSAVAWLGTLGVQVERVSADAD